MTTRTRPENSLRLLARLVGALDARQRTFVFVSNGLVPAAIEFGVNFGVAYSIYHNTSEVTLWYKPFGLFYDMLAFAATSVLITFAIESRRTEAVAYAAFRDVADAAAAAAAAGGPPSNSRRQTNADPTPAFAAPPRGDPVWPSFLLWLVDIPLPASDYGWFRRMRPYFARGMALGGVLGLPYLALATATLMAIGRSVSPIFDGTTSWAPEASAAVGAFLLKLISGPLIALLALVRTAWWIRDDASTSSVEQLPQYPATDLENGGAAAER
ncbi:hypothetical protein HK405_004061, partial [Cladochytrium tenue]